MLQDLFLVIPLTLWSSLHLEVGLLLSLLFVRLLLAKIFS